MVHAYRMRITLEAFLRLTNWVVRFVHFGNQSFMRQAAIGSLGSAPTNSVCGTGTRFEMANDRAARQLVSDINPLSDAQGIFKFNAKIAHSAVNFRVTE